MLTDGHGAQGDVAHRLRAADPQPRPPAHRRDGQRSDRRRHRGRRAAPQAQLVATLQPPPWPPMPDAPGCAGGVGTVLLLHRPCCAARHRRMAAVALGPRRRRDGGRRVAASRALAVARRHRHRRRRLADRHARPHRKPSGRPPPACNEPPCGCRCGRGWSRAASRGRRASSPTTRVGRSATPRPSASPSGPRAELPVVPEDDRTAWSNAAGAVARRQGPLSVPARLRPPSGARALVGGLAVGTGIVLLQRLLLDIAKGYTLGRVHRRQLRRPGGHHPQHRHRHRRGPAGAAAVGRCGSSIAGAFDLFATIERRGLVVRARRPQRVVPLPVAARTARQARPLLAVRRRRRRPF